MRRFVLQRHVDLTGVSGTGVVAEGVEFSDGVVVLHWTSAWPSSVVHYDRGMDSVRHVHGHDGATDIVFLDDNGEGPRCRSCGQPIEVRESGEWGHVTLHPGVDRFWCGDVRVEPAHVGNCHR